MAKPYSCSINFSIFHPSSETLLFSSPLLDLRSSELLLLRTQLLLS